MAFDRKSFDWKQAIYNQGERLTRVEVSLENHLKHHQRWLGWKMSVLCTVIGGGFAWTFRDAIQKILEALTN